MRQMGLYGVIGGSQYKKTNNPRPGSAIASIDGSPAHSTRPPRSMAHPAHPRNRLIERRREGQTAHFVRCWTTRSPEGPSLFLFPTHPLAVSFIAWSAAPKYVSHGKFMNFDSILNYGHRMSRTRLRAEAIRAACVRTRATP